jgi:hypothetical protein
MTNKRPLKSWREFLPMAGESRYERQRRRAASDPDYKAHLQAVRRMPSAVQEAWDLYMNDKAGEIYPFGFAYHFPLQWRWKELQDMTQSGRETLSQRALKAADLGPDTERAPDGSVDRWPSGRSMGTDGPGVDPDFDAQDAFDFMGSPSGSDAATWRGDDGKLYLVDRLTGEILSEVDETDPPF